MRRAALARGHVVGVTAVTDAVRGLASLLAFEVLLTLALAGVVALVSVLAMAVAGR